MTRPPFAYYGGKTMLAEKIVALLPPHRHYVEPFAGSLAVLLAKPRSTHETVNDLDGDLMHFWRIVRDRPDELAAAAALTPHSRLEHEAAYDRPDGLDDIERARRIWITLSQGRSGTFRKTGWRFYRDPGGTSAAMPRYLAAYADRIPTCAHRLAGVSLECRPALDLITSYGQVPDMLLYCDPPYDGATRARNYRHEMTSPESHRDLAEVLHSARATVVLSGYPSPLYDEIYADWHRTEIDAWTGGGLNAGMSKRDGTRTELLLSNRPLAGNHDQLEIPEYAS